MKSHVNGFTRRCDGLTLLELLITLAIGGITLSLAIPAMGALTGNNARSSSINTMISHIQLGRSEAITRARRTILCPSLDGQTCNDSIIWDQGYILVEDSNNNKTVDSDDTLLRVFQGLSDRITVHSTLLRKRILFNPLGMSPGYNLTLSFCDKQQVVEPKAVIVSNTGRPRLSQTKSDGSPIDCP
ncbi:GspH/FimT family pseudopilin [Sedimenticola sp.]|uniref:GspH/FimT family pseudopilin n=1 Tax=Sedimenticola sp. TaxID=1940285 RepID=UPI00258B6DD1|nr:GspH/FimT family protein [Sedimenticola sp.]MCW8904562.1 GspH/FimT family protein [Sedimenticola sp.]